MFRLYIRALLFLFPERGRHMISVCCNIRCINLMYTRNTSITCVPILQITYGMSCTTNPFNPSQSALRRLRGCFHKKVGYGASGYGVCLWNNYGTIQKVQLKNVHRSVMFCIIEGLRRSITKKHHRAVNVFSTLKPNVVAHLPEIGVTFLSIDRQPGTRTWRENTAWVASILRPCLITKKYVKKCPLRRPTGKAHRKTSSELTPYFCLVFSRSEGGGDQATVPPPPLSYQLIYMYIYVFVSIQIPR